MRRSGRRIHATEFGTCKSPTGQCVRHVFPLNNSSQFWVTESGVPFEKRRVNGTFQWANGGDPTKLPHRMSTVWAIALAWTEPPDIDLHFPLRPIRLPGSDALSPSSIVWTRCSSHRTSDANAPATSTSCETGDDTTEHTADCTADDMADDGTSGRCVQWTPLLALPAYVRADGHTESIKLAAGDYHVTQSGILRTRHSLIYEPIRTHLRGRPRRLAMPEGSAFVHEVCTARTLGRIDMRTARHDMVYNCVVDAGYINTTCIRNRIGSMGNEQTIHSAVFQCIKVRPAGDIDMVFIEATTSPRVRAVCLDVMRRDPDATSAAVVLQLCAEQPLDATQPWQLYAEVRIACELIRKFEFDPPDGW